MVARSLPLKVHGFGWEEDSRVASVMERVTVRGKSASGCRSAWGSKIHDGDLCALGSCDDTEDNGLLCSDACRGDSGGLLVHMPFGPNRETEVFGVVSRGSVDCGSNPTHPGIYTSFSQHAAFLREALAAAQPQPQAPSPATAPAPPDAASRAAPPHSRFCLGLLVFIAFQFA